MALGMVKSITYYAERVSPAHCADMDDGRFSKIMPSGCLTVMSEFNLKILDVFGFAP